MAKGLVEFHEKAKSYDWDFTAGDKSPKYPTKYTIPAKGRDPFRTLVRDYMKMEAEKDDRTYGFLDGALRMGLVNFAVSLVLGVTAAWAGRHLGTAW